MKLKNLSALALLGAGLIIGNSASAQWTRVGSKTYVTNVGDSIGIGTTNPAYKVDIQSSGIATMSLKSTTSNANILFDRKTPTGNATITYRTNGVNNWQTGTIGSNNYVLKNNSLNTVAVYCDYLTNNVGIGSAAPTNKLSVTGNANFTGNTGFGSTTTPSPNTRAFFNYVTGGNRDATVVIASGNCGALCGQPSPTTGLLLYNSNPTNSERTGIGFGEKSTYSNDYSYWFGLVRTGSAESGTGDLYFRSGNAGVFKDRVVFKDNGNVGIGTNAPSDKLTLSDSDNSNTSFKFINITNGFTNSAGISLKNFASYDRALQFQNYNTSATANTIAYNFLSNSNFEILSLLNGGNVGIGTNAPFYNLEVNGTAGKPGGGSWIATSDARLKQNVQQYTDGLAQVMKINPVKYHYNETSGYDAKPEYVGVLAQELKEVAPYMVGSFNKEGKEYYNVDNSAMVYMLINAVKELGRQNELKEAKNADLQNQLNEMQQCVQSLCSNYSLKKSSLVDFIESKLMQNEPNPFNLATIIRYDLNGNNSNAQLVIRDLNGNIMKSFLLVQSGKGQVTVNATELTAGTYTYSLIVNSETVDTKLMVITK